MKILFTLFLAFAFPALADDKFCASTGQLIPGLNDSKMWVELSQKLAVEAATQDLKGFCQWNRMDRTTGALKINDQPDLRALAKYREAKATGLADDAAQILEPITHTDAWEYSLTGHPKLKDNGSWFTNICQDDKPSRCASQLSEALAAPDLKSNYDTPKLTSQGPLNISSTEISGACAFLSPLSTLGCSSASHRLLKILEVHHHEDTSYQTDITGAPLIVESLQNPKITKALQNVAVNLWKKIDEKKFGADDNIFDELSQELTRSGLPAKLAKKEAVKILGAIATGGPNFALRANLKDVTAFPSTCTENNSCNLNGVFMAAIAEGLSHADSVKMGQDPASLYSLPRGAGFPCDSGKSYHFWMTAALTDRLIDEGWSASAAKAAVFAGQLGYHLRGSNGRGNNVLGMSRYGAIENGLRMDIHLASAGISFGSRLKTSTGAEEMKIGEAYVKTLKEGNINPAQNGAFHRSMGEVYEWTDRLAVKSVFSSYP